jgi:hypothetical protein
MRNQEFATWVVYLMTLHNKPSVKAVCEQSEWDAMEIARPGYHQLIRGGVESETEAERLARASPVD